MGMAKSFTSCSTTEYYDIKPTIERNIASMLYYFSAVSGNYDFAFLMFSDIILPKGYESNGQKLAEEFKKWGVPCTETPIATNPNTQNNVKIWIFEFGETENLINLIKKHYPDTKWKDFL